MERLDYILRSGAPVDYSKMTIEHIAPENPPSGVAQEQGEGKLGNLLLLDQATNVAVGNQPFADRKAAYTKAGTPFDQTLKKATAWRAAEIDARTRALAELAHSNVFRV